jgi:hypothetical protein
VNPRTGATELTATIRANDLAYLNWKRIHSMESVYVSMVELHACLNHMPHADVRRLIHSKTVGGLPDGLVGNSRDAFRDDCANGKFTRAAHSKPAARGDPPLLRVFSDVHPSGVAVGTSTG